MGPLYEGAQTNLFVVMILKLTRTLSVAPLPRRRVAPHTNLE
jgi:hypothetical protein